MLTLEANKTKFWIVEPTGKVENIDSEGFQTGTFTTTYSEPTEIHLSAFPNSGDVSSDMFGIKVSVDLVVVDVNDILSEDTLIFISEPVSNYRDTYDYRVSGVMRSINVYRYSLTKRVK